jgi:hypothetical protein
LKLPFWDCLLLVLSTSHISAKTLLRRATPHNSQDVDSFFIGRVECTESRLRQLIEGLSEGQMLTISSKILTTDDRQLHLPMLVFHCEATSENDVLVKSVMEEIGQAGYVAYSGKSYHLYGRSLIDESSLVSLLGKALLFSPIVDRAWIAHQIIERACGLRISPGKEYKECPRIIYEVC